MSHQSPSNRCSLNNQSIYLRDMSIEDIEDYINWNTTEVEWQDWDAPWEIEEISMDELKGNLLERLSRVLPEIRRRFEICTMEDKHIGWVTSYYIDGDKERLAVGLSIPYNDFRCKGMGESALTLFISYLLKSGFASEIYTQTWSGNHRMVRLAEKCGFEIVNREIDYREVRGNMYDGLTFKLNKDFFRDKFSHLQN